MPSTKKPGYKTTEFWLTVAASIVGLMMASGFIEATSTAIDDKIIGLISMILVSLGYTTSRTIIKK